jgi:peptidoglycan/xylan/chitin deacetylase (PgdA/CDA1 family)
MRFINISLLLFLPAILYSQTNPYSNPNLLKQLSTNTRYQTLKTKTIASMANVAAGRWGEFVKGVKTDLATNQKLVAFTFDACGGSHISNGFDAELISYLRREKIPATLFVTGKWIDANYKTLLNLAADTLFEIENHGLRHRPCSVNGNIAYEIQGTLNAAEAFEEVEANAEKIQLITGRKPLFYRSATAYIDEAGARMVAALGYTVVSYGVLSCDAMPDIPARVIETCVLEHAKPGSLVIMHFNHPEHNTSEAMQEIVPQLRKKGYSFVKLQGNVLKGKGK